MSHTYKDLIVWQRSIDLIEKVYRLTRAFPRDEVYGLTAQCAAVSVASNVAEGQGRMTTGEFRHFVGQARGWHWRWKHNLIIAERLGYVEKAALAPAFQDCDEIKRMLHGLAESLTEMPAKNQCPANHD